MTHRPVPLLTTALILLASPLCGQTLRGQTPSADATERPLVPVLRAVRVEGREPSIDGRMEEAIWSTADVAEGFTQFEPDEGAPAAQRTEARVVYGEEALFVAIRAFDTEPGLIAGQLTRRDQYSYSDQVAVIIDSYFDRRTAFMFAVNPVGVKLDVYYSQDTNEDENWDAVWDVATTVDAEGWTAEFRIPYSQLRFRPGPEQTWGINFMRRIARRDERSVWAPTRRSESAIVSKLGELRGITDFDPPRRLEIQPYTLAKMDRAPGEVDNPFWSHNDLSGAVGADVKYGVTSNLTLDVTINPDFGQVEADPSQVNLTAFETFFGERRPFFVEGSSLFAFPPRYRFAFGGDANNPFYSRRLGRAPQGDADEGDGHASVPERATILGAAKLSGKTADGWSVGVIEAVTAEERARVAPVTGARFDTPVEPLSNYLVARVSRDFREGKTALGAIGTWVRRDPTVADALDLRRNAYTGGVDGRHRFGDDRWEVEGYLLGSRVMGSEAAIVKAQRSSAHYFQRPDADHLVLDSARTGLSGVAFGAHVARFAGGPWRFGADVYGRTPGYEVNDAGYMRETDLVSPSLYLGYDQSTPAGIFRRWRINTNAFSAWSTGGERFGTAGGNVNGNFQLRSFWGGNFGLTYQSGGLDLRELRGGPALRQGPRIDSWLGFGSDNRKAVSFNLDGGLNESLESDSRSWRVSPGARFRPSSQTSFDLSLEYSRNHNDAQWVERIDAGEPVYLFGRLNQTTLGLTARADLAFTPTLSLQIYAQPFISAGSYEAFKRVADPRAERYVDRFAPVHASPRGDEYFADVDGDGLEDSFDDPDFNVREFRSNTVLRWEYRPGSTLFLVWAQSRDGSDAPGLFDVAGDTRELFRAEPRNVFMIKVSYWLNP